MKKGERKWNIQNPRIFLINLFMKFKDLKSFGKMRFIIGFKGK